METLVYLYNDRSQQAYYEAIVFVGEKVIVTFPSDPLDDQAPRLYDYGVQERRNQIRLDAQSRGIEIDWFAWKYFEVRPDPERLYIRTATLKEEQRMLIFKELSCDFGLTRHFDFSELDQIAQKYGRPTIQEYYAKVQLERMIQQNETAANMQMVKSWTDECSTPDLLAILHRDLSQNLIRIRSCDWSWHYIVYDGSLRTYYRSANTEFMVRSFIAHAEDCLRRGVPVRFSYCLPRYMPEGIEYQDAPVQD